jgi:hypothetical protein
MTKDGATTSYAYNDGNELCWRASGDSNAGCSSPPSGATTFSYDLNGGLISSSDGLHIDYNALN